ncbi:MAG: hexosyltransferase, partial [Halobacteriaceae archaeon]
MVHYGESPHPAHQGFAESVGADIIPCSPENDIGLLSRGKEVLRGAQLEYDVLIAEGSRPLIPMLFQGLIRDCKVLYLCADQFFYDMNFSADSSAAKTYIANSVLKNIVDGVIAVSDFAAEFVRAAVGASIPIRIVHPYIQEDLFEELEDVSPDLHSATAVTISSAPNGLVGQYKGVDLLVESWSEVRDEFPDATLRVVGERHPEAYEEQEGVQL